MKANRRSRVWKRFSYACNEPRVKRETHRKLECWVQELCNQNIKRKGKVQSKFQLQEHKDHCEQEDHLGGVYGGRRISSVIKVLT